MTLGNTTGRNWSNNVPMNTATQSVILKDGQNWPSAVLCHDGWLYVGGRTALDLLHEAAQEAEDQQQDRLEHRQQVRNGEDRDAQSDVLDRLDQIRHRLPELHRIGDSGDEVLQLRDDVHQLDEARARSIARLVELGYTDQILLSHDVCFKRLLHWFGGPGYDHLLTGFVPLLRDAGVADADIQRMLVDNPRRALASYS